MSPKEVFDTMWRNDRFSSWLGLELQNIDAGSCRLLLRIRPDMLNGFGTVHGGVLFSAADAAFAFSCNTRGHIAVALEASIHFTQPVEAGAEITIEATELYLGNKTGVYEVKLYNERKTLVAVFKGTAYRTSRILHNGK